MTSYPRFEKLLEYALAVHEALRRLGFDAKDIWVAPLLDRDMKTINFGVQLLTQGKEFGFALGRWADIPSEEALRTRWRQLVEKWNSGVDLEWSDRIYADWLREIGGKINLPQEIMKEGIHIPAMKPVWPMQPARA